MGENKGQRKTCAVAADLLRQIKRWRSCADSCRSIFHIGAIVFFHTPVRHSRSPTHRSIFTDGFLFSLFLLYFTKGVKKKEKQSCSLQGWWVFWGRGESCHSTLGGTQTSRSRNAPCRIPISFTDVFSLSRCKHTNVDEAKQPPIKTSGLFVHESNPHPSDCRGKGRSERVA